MVAFETTSFKGSTIDTRRIYSDIDPTRLPAHDTGGVSNPSELKHFWPSKARSGAIWSHHPHNTQNGLLKMLPWELWKVTGGVIKIFRDKERVFVALWPRKLDIISCRSQKTFKMINVNNVNSFTILFMSFLCHHVTLIISLCTREKKEKIHPNSCHILHILKFREFHPRKTFESPWTFHNHCEGKVLIGVPAWSPGFPL